MKKNFLMSSHRIMVLDFLRDKTKYGKCQLSDAAVANEFMQVYPAITVVPQNVASLRKAAGIKSKRTTNGNGAPVGGKEVEVEIRDLLARLVKRFNA